ncbi:MAG TPA: DUF1800 domain-containing protein [Gemmatimonadaceae bacterium]|jgi:uncharacterized protein (DUF1800 family)
MDREQREAETAGADSQESNRKSRRDVLKIGAVLAGATLLPSRTARAQRIARPRPKIYSGFKSNAPNPGGEALTRLVRRTTNGITDEDVLRAKQLGFTRYLEEQLNYTKINDAAVDQYVTANYPTIALDHTQLYNMDQNVVFNELVRSTFYRAAYSKRQLYERMVEFWSDHFNINWDKVQYLQTIDQREVIRKHALGKFPDMLRASAHSVAMLAYLDNTLSRVGRVNQNYAREICELHTLGVDGGYTQQDVEEATRILTGWTLRNRGEFYFDANGHDFNAKTFMGRSFPAQDRSVGVAAIAEGEQLLTFLVTHPSTAKFIATKMTRWMLQYDPPAAVVNAVAAEYTRTGGDIKAMLRKILTPANLMAAPAKFKRPNHLILSTVRSLKPNLTNQARLSSNYALYLGMPYFQWDDPDGYPDRIDFWAGTILLRWNYANYIATNNNDARVDIARFRTVATPEGICAALSTHLFGGEMPATLQQQLTAFLSAAAITDARVRDAIALAVSSSAFMYY